MTLYVWRPQSPADAWERFLVGCLDLIRGALGDRPIVDVSDFTRAEVGVRFREQLGVSADGIFLALCHGTGVSLSGSGGELLTTQDAQLFNGKFCYLIACSAGTLFAGHALRAGAIGFVGFTDIVTIQRGRARRLRRHLARRVDVWRPSAHPRRNKPAEGVSRAEPRAPQWREQDPPREGN